MTRTLLFCLLPLYAVAQQAGNYVQYSNFDPSQNSRFLSVPKTAKIVDDNTIEWRINGLYNKKADAYVAIFSVIQLGRTAEEANTLLNNRIEPLARDIQALGIPAKDIVVDMVNFLPKYELDVSKKLFSKKTFTEIPKGFELQKNLHVRYTEPSQLDKIITVAARQEVYDLVKVDYFDEHPTEAYAELRTRCFEYLEQIKKTYAGAGFPLDSAVTVTAENAWVAYPGNRYESYQAYSGQALDTQEKGASLTPAEKPVSRFYNAVPTNDYDLVINPQVLEPVIQYSFNLIVRFTLPRPAAPQTKSYFLVTPQGELKEIRF